MNNMTIHIIPVTNYEQNCSLLCCKQSNRAAVVDPGGDLSLIMDTAEKAGVEIEKLLITHGHFDHCAAAAELAEQLQVPIEGPHKDDKFLLDSIPEWCQQAGFPIGKSFEPDRWLADGDSVSFGQQELQVVHCPGHTPGHIVFYHQAEKLALVGDVLFKGSIGRTDFPRSNHNDLINAIRHKLFPLGDEVLFVPGHGPTSTFGEERRTNPFVR